MGLAILGFGFLSMTIVGGRVRRLQNFLGTLSSGPVVIYELPCSSVCGSIIMFSGSLRSHLYW